MKYFLPLAILCLFTTCRKKSDIEVTAYNYALGEPIANAEVVIMESTPGGRFFSASSDCRKVASAITNNDGRCTFYDLKLKTRKGVQYSAKIRSSYGDRHSYDCSVTEESEVKKNRSGSLILNSSIYSCNFIVRYKNLLNPSIPGDSLYVYIASAKYEVPGQPYPFGDEVVFIASPSYGRNGFPFASTVLTDPRKTYTGRHILKIYKKKMGAVTQTIDTVKIYPYETKLIEINW